MSKAKPNLYSIIKWVEGVDKDTYSVGVSVEWIIGFDYEEWKSENRDPLLTYVIQWRQPAKKPAKGWMAYDGLVMDVSSSVAQLERKFKLYGGLKSPKNPALNDVERTSLSDQNHALNGTPQPGTSKDDQAPRKVSKKTVNLTATQKRNKETTQNNPRQLQYPCPGTDSDEAPGDSEPESEEIGVDDQTPDDSHLDEVLPFPEPVHNEEIREAQSPNRLNKIGNNTDNQRRKEMRNAAPGAIAPNVINAQQQVLAQGLPDLIENLRRMNDLLERNLMQRDRQQNEEAEPQMVEIGEIGSGIRISKEKWETALEQGTYTAMALSLVSSLYPVDVLLRSNVKGGKSKIHKAEDNPPKHQPLDPKILNAITVSVRRRFPEKFNRAGMNHSINVKLSKMRGADRASRAAVRP